MIWVLWVELLWSVLQSTIAWAPVSTRAGVRCLKISHSLSEPAPTPLTLFIHTHCQLWEWSHFDSFWFQPKLRSSLRLKLKLRLPCLNPQYSFTLNTISCQCRRMHLLAVTGVFDKGCLWLYIVHCIQVILRCKKARAWILDQCTAHLKINGCTRSKLLLGHEFYGHCASIGTAHLRSIVAIVQDCF